MNKILLLWAILATFLFSCNKDFKKDTKSSCEPNSNAQTLTHLGEIREYILYVPDTYDGTVQVPLVFNFHGFGGNANDFMTYADMRPMADSKGFILVYPQGTCLDGYAHWNASLPGGDNKSDADDFGFINELLTKLSSDYLIDLERVYACGYSNGAMFSYALACYHSDKIAAIGSVSGAMLDISETCTPSHPMPVICIHGTSDNVLPYDGNSEFNSVTAVLSYWNTHNNTASTPIFNSVDDNGTIIEHYLYPEGDSGVSVEHYKVIGGEHLWFDMNYEGFNTHDLLWNFFSKYDINGVR